VVTLALRWPGNGSVVFNAPVLTDAEQPAERKARVVTTHFYGWLDEGVRDRVKSLFGEIGTISPDLVCLSEALFTRELRGDTLRVAAEPIGGAVTSLISDLAAKHNTYIVGNFTEVEGDDIFNTSALFNRSGSLVGKYRKAHLPLDEVDSGTAPGSEYPVYETDFARIGMTICWDAAFPELSRQLRLNGAELMVSATLGDFWETDIARARDNGLWYAIAGGNRHAASPYPPSRILDPEGKILCGCVSNYHGSQDSFAFTDIDFNQGYYQFWLSVGPCEGEGPFLYTVERRPDTYKHT
jgi:predicted amidohydrolase